MYKVQTSKYIDQSYAKKLSKDQASAHHRKSQTTYLTMEFQCEQAKWNTLCTWRCSSFLKSQLKWNLLSGNDLLRYYTSYLQGYADFAKVN